MSTTAPSDAGTILVLDEPSTIVKKFKRAVTDSGAEIRRGEGKQGIGNLLEIYAVLRGISIDAAEAEFADTTGYGAFKVAVGEAVAEQLAPVRERYAELRGDEAALEEALA